VGFCEVGGAGVGGGGGGKGKEGKERRERRSWREKIGDWGEREEEGWINRGRRREEEEEAGYVGVGGW